MNTLVSIKPTYWLRFVLSKYILLCGVLCGVSLVGFAKDESECKQLALEYERILNAKSKYKKLSDSLQETLDSISLIIEDLKDQIDTQTKEINEQNKKLDQQESTIEIYEKKIIELESAIAKKNREIERLSRDLISCKDTLSKREKTIDTLWGNIATLNSRVKSLETVLMQDLKFLLVAEIKRRTFLGLGRTKRLHHVYLDTLNINRIKGKHIKCFDFSLVAGRMNEYRQSGELYEVKIYYNEDDWEGSLKNGEDGLSDNNISRSVILCGEEQNNPKDNPRVADYTIPPLTVMKEEKGHIYTCIIFKRNDRDGGTPIRVHAIRFKI